MSININVGRGGGGHVQVLHLGRPFRVTVLKMRPRPLLTMSVRVDRLHVLHVDRPSRTVFVRRLRTALPTRHRRLAVNEKSDDSTGVYLRTASHYSRGVLVFQLGRTPRTECNQCFRNMIYNSGNGMFTCKQTRECKHRCTSDSRGWVHTDSDRLLFCLSRPAVLAMFSRTL